MAVANRSRRTDSEVLPAITLDITPTPPGLQLLSAKLRRFAHEHDLPEGVGTRMVSVASDVADVIARSFDAPPVDRLQADADIGRDDAQIVLIAADHRLLGLYGSLRDRLDRIASRCDAFATQITPTAELQVWASFKLGTS